MLRNIIWDVDGTLFDTYPAMAKALQAALNDLGKDAALEWIERLARKSLSHCVSTLADHYQLKEEDIAEGFGTYYSRTTPEEQPPFPGVTTICATICSIGGKNIIVTHRGRASTHELLAAHEMTAYFAGCLTRDDGYPRKPDPTAFEVALNTHGLKREETIAVGDRDIDILAGQGAGVSTCLFGPEIEGLTADLTISSFDKLYEHIMSERRWLLETTLRAVGVESSWGGDRMQQLVNRFAQVRRSLLGALKGFPADGVEAVVFGEWNLRCVLAHLAGWDSYLTEILGLLRAGEDVPYWGSIKQFNEASVKKREGWTWDDVYDEFVGAGEAFIEQYGSVGEELRSRRFWEGRSYTPTKVVEINTHHYESHLEEIRNACPSSSN